MDIQLQNWLAGIGVLLAVLGAVLAYSALIIMRKDRNEKNSTRETFWAGFHIGDRSSKSK